MSARRRLALRDGLQLAAYVAAASLSGAMYGGGGVGRDDDDEEAEGEGIMGWAVGGGAR